MPCFWVGLVFCKDSNSKLATPHNSRSTIKVDTILKLQATMNTVKLRVLTRTMRTNLLNWCDLVSISKNVVFLGLLGGKN